MSNQVGDTLVEFLEMAAQRYGPRTALLFKPVFRYQRWTYDELWESAGRMATALQRKGLNKGDRVVIWGPNSPQWVISFFGSMRAGLTVVPLDVRCPADFVDKVASQTEPKLAFVSRIATPEFRSSLNVPEVYFEELEREIEDLPEPDLVEVGPGDLAEIMFTSGTTGDPKGVMLTHRNITSNTWGASQHMPGNSLDRLVSILPLSHMFEQVGGLLLVLLAGANVTYLTARQPSVMQRTMRERGVTMLLLVPQGLELMMNGIEREVALRGTESLWKKLMWASKRLPFSWRRVLFQSVHQKFGGSLELIVCGAAALDPQLAEKWELLGVKIAQGYGATEASPVITLHEQDKTAYDSVGPSIPGVDLRIAEDGEILIRGPNITPGYWNAPERTAEVFEGDWYKTGDLGTLDEKGFLRLNGRKKDMIVLPSGQNVFPDDLETVLKRQDAVKDAVVVGVPKGPGTEVHAAIIGEDAAEIERAVTLANAQLGEYQQIRGHTIWPDDDFPRTHTLKVRKGIVAEMLAAGTFAAPASAGEPDANAAPSTSRGLENIVAEVSGRPVADVAEDKALGTDLGMDSLGRIELLAAIEVELGVFLEESQIDESTTVSALADLVKGGSRQQREVKFPAWGMSWWCRPVRGTIQRSVVFPLLKATCGLSVTGRENLSGLDGPALIVANHNYALDNGLILKAMPSTLRRRTAIAGAAYLWDSPLWAVINPLVGNGFPFSQEGAVRASLDNLGEVFDKGWSVLLYAEGKLTQWGPIQPFLSGAGLIAVEGGVPVVPVQLHINDMGRLGAFPIARRGDIEIRFGEPIAFAPGTDYAEAASRIEENVRAL